MNDNYRRLNIDDILKYTEVLSQRIQERFPKRGLTPVSQDLLLIAKNTQARIAWITRPIMYLRVAIGVVVFMMAIFVISGLTNITVRVEDASLIDIVTLIEAGIQDLIFLGAGIYFLTSFENRLKRKRSLDSLNELRALAHVIDMHQLTKEPEHVLQRGKDTQSSPKRELDGFLLGRYLDYCSEMLSIVGKLAALYVQDFDDAVVLGAVNEIESLASGLSRKIWQKIMIIHQLEQDIK